MNRRVFLAIALLASTPWIDAALAASNDTRCFEMRVYYAAEGKLEDLQARFRDHTTKLFEKHGMTNIGYWTPLADAGQAQPSPDPRLIYILAYPSREAREESWKNFVADPAWKAAQSASEKGGKLVAKAESTFLEAADFSPAIKPSVGDKPRIFELRTYTAREGKLEPLLDRFRQHTVALFAKYGMTNIGYWTLSKGQPGADNTLIYILAHPSKDERAAAFKSFGSDPAWVAARKASEQAAGGSLTALEGVKSLLLAPTDYSPMR
ncbi:MAG: NIPSNAP family protein [Verrucomicrobiales bacterium]